MGEIMLSELLVRHFAVIEEIEVGFDPGLTMITGETGAGKSIIVGAVNLILGGRASQELIRTGCQEALVQARFLLDAHPRVRRRLEAAGLTASDELIVSRTIHRSGRNKVFVNGHLVTLQQLQELTRDLISVSGQHEHQQLLDSDRHLRLLDHYARLEKERLEVAARYRNWAAVRSELERFNKLRQQQLQQRDFLLFQLQELEAAQLQADEDLQLESERNLLKHAQTLHDAADRAHQLLYSDHGSALETLGEAEKEIRTLCAIDPHQHHLNEHLEQARIHLDELCHGLQQYAASISFDPYRLNEIEDRLALIQRLTKKYGGTVSELIERREELQRAVEEIDDPEAREAELRRRLADLGQAYLDRARDLSDKRRRAAQRLAGEVAAILEHLDLPRARFAVRFDPAEPATGDTDVHFSPAGIDQAEFLLSANPGEDLKPLAKVASGGELSRILLALKSLLGDRDHPETLIFDEVDTGIGGRTAELVGLQLQRLASHHQVICITHLPQIACYGEQHFRVIKESTERETQTTIRPLSRDQRVEELARMLGGVSISRQTRAHAREWLEKSQSH